MDNGSTTMSFVEWKEEFISQERGKRVVHYILKDSSGDSVLAVVGTERSLRHMVYVVADEFLDVCGYENATQSGYKWRSRREVVDWLTSMLSKQQLQQNDSPRNGSKKSLGLSNVLFDAPNDQHVRVPTKVNFHARNLKQPLSDIRWVGVSWVCGKQLTHYPAFCRNGTTISIHSFIFVMAEEETRYLAYLEDMYEDKKGQKKVRVRWFHHSHEVKGTVRIQNAHPKEVFFTPYAQVISVECIDGPAVILTQEHFEKCLDRFSHTFLNKVHLCFRQFRTNKIKPFDLKKLKGYLNQPILSCLESNDVPLKPDILGHSIAENEIKALFAREDSIRGFKRTRNYSEQSSFLTVHSGAQIYRGHKKIKFDSFSGKMRKIESRSWHGWTFELGGKIELLCQDSGIRGCWFRCTVKEMSRKKMRVQYDDVDDQDGCGKLEEWVPAFRLASLDKLGMRSLGRPVIRPQPPSTNLPGSFLEVGAPVDAWWSDGWWEGVVTEVKGGEDDKLQIYTSAENLYLEVSSKDLRVSRDWVEGQWIDVKPKHDILSAISSVLGPESKPSLNPSTPAQSSGHESGDDFNEGSDDVSTKDTDAGDEGNGANVDGPSLVEGVNFSDDNVRRDGDKEYNGNGGNMGSNANSHAPVCVIDTQETELKEIVEVAVG